jgi:phosphopantothenoylcysteine decarboxylase/phosphopantothenate--cysteine ligase
MKQTVVLGVTSGIAAYKALDIVRLLKEKNIDVIVTMSDAASNMVSPHEFEKVSEHPIVNELFPQNFDYKKVLKERVVDHIAIADSADCLVIAPATANVIGKLAQGIADDFLTTTALAVTKPILICPSMNVHMWQNPAVQENLTILRQRGYVIIEPEEGQLACGYEGIGRLADPKTIVNEVLQTLQYSHSLQGKKILVTAGGTIEAIDDVRFISNRSSGKMGVAIAQACYLRGADVLLLRSKTSVQSNYPIAEKVFTSAEDLSLLIKKHIQEFAIMYHAAAVSDFSVKNKRNGKVSSDESLTVTLTPQVKILDEIKKLHPEIYLVAFKAEYESDEKKLITTALERLKQANANAIIVNDISQSDRGFEVDTNEVYIVFPDGKAKHFPLMSKRESAKAIVDVISKEN